MASELIKSPSYFGVYIPNSSSLNIASPPSSPWPNSPAGDGPVVVPSDSVPSDVPEPGVFDSFVDALALVKKFKDKGARFKGFFNEQAALRFSEGFEFPDSPSGDFLSSSVGDTPPTPFSSLSRPELTKLKKAIESNSMSDFETMVDGNPRYLINCGGTTPTIIYEGCRYNALHIAARTGNSNVARVVLQLISDPTCHIIKRVYPDCTDEVNESNRQFLLDHYLNTPDKSMNETPLHFAAKLGFVDVVRLLTSYPECRRDTKNKYDETAADMICAKVTKMNDDDKKKAAEEIEILLLQPSTNYYVPLYRPSDFSGAPLLLKPVLSYPCLSCIQSAGTDTVISSPVVRSESKLSAVAGPFSAESLATAFYKQWCNAKSLDKEITRSDIHKGVERVGRKLATNFKVKWTESWPFSDQMVDLREEEGLKILNKVLSREPLKMVNSPGRKSPVKVDFLSRRLDFGQENEDDEEVFVDCQSSWSPNCGKRMKGEDVDMLGEKFDLFTFDSDVTMSDSFETPPSSPAVNFLTGKAPTKVDFDAYNAVTEVALVGNLEWFYPAVASWYKAIEIYSDAERHQWPSLDSPRGKMFKSRVVS